MSEPRVRFQLGPWHIEMRVTDEDWVEVRYVGNNPPFQTEKEARDWVHSKSRPERFRVVGPEYRQGEWIDPSCR